MIAASSGFITPRPTIPLPSSPFSSRTSPSSHFPSVLARAGPRTLPEPLYPWQNDQLCHFPAYLVPYRTAHGKQPNVHNMLEELHSSQNFGKFIKTTCKIRKIGQQHKVLAVFIYFSATTGKIFYAFTFALLESISLKCPTEMV